MAGLETIAPGADVIVVIDVLTLGTALELALAHGLEVFPRPAADAHSWAQSHDAVLVGAPGESGEPGEPRLTLSPASITSESAERIPGERIVVPTQDGSVLTGVLAGGFNAPVVLAGLRNRLAVARWIRAEQARTTGRFTIAIVAAGELRDDSSLRFTVEDQLAAGALVDALAELAIDYHSPEAAAACAGFTGLRRAVRQLIKASASGRELIEHGLAQDVELASQVDVSKIVPVFSGLSFLTRSDDSHVPD